MRTIGTISLKRGERAVKDEEPESERLFRCVSRLCHNCNVHEHSDPLSGNYFGRDHACCGNPVRAPKRDEHWHLRPVR